MSIVQASSSTGKKYYTCTCNVKCVLNPCINIGPTSGCVAETVERVWCFTSSAMVENVGSSSEAKVIRF